MRNDPLNATDPSGEELKIIGDDAHFEGTNDDLAVIQQIPEGRTAARTLAESEHLTIIAQPGADERIDSAARDLGQPANTTFEARLDDRDTTVIYYDRSLTEGGADDTGSRERPTVVALAHELPHAVDSANGIPPPEGPLPIIPGTTPPSEVGAINLENAMRDHLGLPRRSNYFAPDE